jgi:hypothetical protein
MTCHAMNIGYATYFTQHNFEKLVRGENTNILLFQDKRTALVR